jgi:hypothetical protein
LEGVVAINSPQLNSRLQGAIAGRFPGNNLLNQSYSACVVVRGSPHHTFLAVSAPALRAGGNGGFK